MATATQQLLDLVKRAQADISDYRAAQLIGLSDASVSRWRTGKGHMSMANIRRACDLAGIAERTWEWQIRIGSEREQGPDGDLYREALQDLEAVAEGRPPSPVGLYALLRQGGRAAIILIAGMAAGASLLLPGKSAFAAGSVAAEQLTGLSIMRSRYDVANLKQDGPDRRRESPSNHIGLP